MVTSADAKHRPVGGIASARISVLRMGLPGRLAMAAGGIIVVWSAIAFGLS